MGFAPFTSLQWIVHPCCRRISGSSDLDEAMTCVKLGLVQQRNYFCSTCIDHFTGNCIIQSPLLKQQQHVRCDKRV
jgi:hypothetical protein